MLLNMVIRREQTTVLPNLLLVQILVKKSMQDMIICMRNMIRLTEVFMMLRINWLQIILTMFPMTVRFQTKTHIRCKLYCKISNFFLFSNISDVFSNFLENICANNVRVKSSDVAISQNDQNPLLKAATLISKSHIIPYDIVGLYLLLSYDFE